MVLHCSLARSRQGPQLVMSDDISALFFWSHFAFVFCTFGAFSALHVPSAIDQARVEGVLYMIFFQYCITSGSMCQIDGMRNRLTPSQLCGTHPILHH